MKTIGLMLTRNEGHILPYTLPPLAQVCDHIIVADQNSTDDTRAVIKKCTKAILIDNPPSPPDGNYDTQGRQLLLNAARNFDGHNLLLMIDADEIAPPAVFCHLKEDIGRYPIGMKFATPWVLIWKKASRYLVPEGWMQPSRMNWIWYDDRQHQYQETCWVHSGRIPSPPAHVPTLPYRYSLLHFQWLFLEDARWKQAWYQMMEFKNAQFDVGRLSHINALYHPSNTLADDPFALTRRLPKKWRTGYDLPQNDDDSKPNWHKDEIWQMTEKHGIEIFEPLNIWYVAELKNHFEQTLKRPPQSQMLPRKNMLRSQLFYATQLPRMYAAIKKPERAIRRTTWYKKLKGKPL